MNNQLLTHSIAMRFLHAEFNQPIKLVKKILMMIISHSYQIFKLHSLFAIKYQ